MRLRFWTATALAAMGAVGCGGDDSSTGATTAATSSSGSGGGGGAGCTVDTSYDPPIEPQSFVGSVDNPLYPLVPGTTFTYTAGDETVVVEVLPDTKVIMGVTCTVVHDVASVGGNVIEDTFDWFAQAADGSVWYFGEDTKELNMMGDIVSTEGSWEGGVDGAKPGIVVQGMPMVGQKYRQEYYACHAEDMGEVLDLDASVTVPQGMYTGCLKTKDTTPLEPDVNEEKYYCPDVGLVLSVDVATGDREELISVMP